MRKARQIVPLSKDASYPGHRISKFTMSVDAGLAVDPEDVFSLI